jgi:hypothetical protein
VTADSRRHDDRPLFLVILSPYAPEVWPSKLRTSGVGSAYGFGGIGKIFGPIGLALIVGSPNIVKPEVTIVAIVPSFIYLASWSVIAGIAYAFIGFETRGRSIEEIDRRLAAERKCRAGRASLTSRAEAGSARAAAETRMGPAHTRPYFNRAQQEIRLQNELFLPCSPRSLVAYASCVSKLPKSRIAKARLAHSIR